MVDRFLFVVVPQNTLQILFSNNNIVVAVVVVRVAVVVTVIIVVIVIVYSNNNNNNAIGLAFVFFTSKRANGTLLIKSKIYRFLVCFKYEIHSLYQRK